MFTAKANASAQLYSAEATIRGSMNLRALKALCNMEDSKCYVSKIASGSAFSDPKISQNHMHLRWTMVGPASIVFFLGNPHLLEGGEGCEDGTTDPNAVLPFRWSNHLDPHSGRCKSTKLLGHALTNTWQHGRTT